jgi:hypothetical protein
MCGTCSTHGKMRNLYKNLTRKCQEKTLLGRAGRRLEDMMKMDCWIHGGLETSGGLFRIWQRNLKGGEFLDQLSDSQEKLCFKNLFTAI